MSGGAAKNTMRCYQQLLTATGAEREQIVIAMNDLTRAELCDPAVGLPR